MEKYISKSAIVKEIEKRLSIVLDPFNHDIHTNRLEETYKDILSLLNTLKVKEVDLEKEFFDWYHEEKNRDYNASILYERYSTTSKKLAKHFFELGLKEKNI